MKYLLIIFATIFFFSPDCKAQNVGIGTTSPQATLDVKGNQRLGGVTRFTTYDSSNGKIEWKNSNLYVPVSQYLMQHSAAADGLYYNNSAPISGQLEYRNQFGNPVFYTNFINGNGYFSNRLGIGNLAPQFPLSFNGALGDKISLWTDGTPTHYGFGIQSGLFQMFSKTDFDDIGFGYGSSSSFSEVMRIKGNGKVGIGIISPTAKLSISSNGVELAGTAASNTFWTNAGTLGSSPGSEISLANIGFLSNSNSSLGIRAYRSSPGSDWTSTALLLGYDVDNTVRAGGAFLAISANGNIGIRNATPNAPLSFPPALGKKITLYPGTTGDVGMAVQGNLLQIYSDNPNADVAIGYDQAGVFTERFRVRANGALLVNGNAGLTGQVLQSNGTAAAPAWVSPVKYFESTASSNFTLTNNGDEAIISTVTVTVTQTSFIEVYGTVGLNALGCFNCGDAHIYLLLNDPSTSSENIIAANPRVLGITTMGFVHRTYSTVGPGSYVFTLKVKKIVGGGLIVGSSGYTSPYASPFGKITAKVIPE